MFLTTVTPSSSCLTEASAVSGSSTTTLPHFLSCLRCLRHSSIAASTRYCSVIGRGANQFFSIELARVPSTIPLISCRILMPSPDSSTSAVTIFSMSPIPAAVPLSTVPKAILLGSPPATTNTPSSVVKSSSTCCAVCASSAEVGLIQLTNCG